VLRQPPGRRPGGTGNARTNVRIKVVRTAGRAHHAAGLANAFVHIQSDGAVNPMPGIHAPGRTARLPVRFGAARSHAPGPGRLCAAARWG